jgi:hypothetical protein
MADTQPKSDAVVASLASADDAEAAIAEITNESDVAVRDIAHGTGEEFAAELDRSDPDSEPGSRLGHWLTSLGQDRERLVELGEAARKGRYVMVVNGVTDDETKEAVIAVLQRHGADDMTYIGNWQNEDIL